MNFLAAYSFLTWNCGYFPKGKLEGECLAVNILQSTASGETDIVCIHRTCKILHTQCPISKAENSIVFHDFPSKQNIFRIYHLFLYNAPLVENNAWQMKITEKWALRCQKLFSFLERYLYLVYLGCELSHVIFCLSGHNYCMTCCKSAKKCFRKKEKAWIMIITYYNIVAFFKHPGPNRYTANNYSYDKI
jgi:hypothetical protein